MASKWFKQSISDSTNHYSWYFMQAGLKLRISENMRSGVVFGLAFNHLAPVVQRGLQKVESAIHRINLYPVDNAINFLNTCPLDSDLFGVQRFAAFEQPKSSVADHICIIKSSICNYSLKRSHSHVNTNTHALIISKSEAKEKAQ